MSRKHKEIIKKSRLTKRHTQISNSTNSKKNSANADNDIVKWPPVVAPLRSGCERQTSADSRKFVLVASISCRRQKIKSREKRSAQVRIYGFLQMTFEIDQKNSSGPDFMLHHHQSPPHRRRWLACN